MDSRDVTYVPPEPAGGWPWAPALPPGLSPYSQSSLFAIGDIVEDAAEKWPDRAALDFRGNRISYCELFNNIEAFRTRLQQCGLAAGDRVALYLPNTPAYPIAFFSAVRSGVIVVNLSPLDSEPTIRHKLSDSGATFLVTTNFAGLRVSWIAQQGLVKSVIVIDDALWGESSETTGLPEGRNISSVRSLEKTVSGLPEKHRGDLDDIVLLQYTGGTTGHPKAAVLTHRNLSASINAFDAWQVGYKEDLPAPQKILLYLPLFHIYGLSVILFGSLWKGHTLLLRTRFDAEGALAEIENGASVFPGVPTMWIAICAVPGIEKRDLSHLKRGSSGGAPMPVEVARRFSKMTGVELLEGWGMSETAPAGTRRPPRIQGKEGSIGIPMPGVFVKVVDAGNPRRDMAAGETGELAICGQNVTSGYWNRPEESRHSFFDNWFLTGDIGYRDEDGFIFLVDRKKDMIISSGFNVYPQMIEQAIYEHDDVEEVLVIGIADDYRGESAKAFIKMRPGAKELTLSSLQEFLKPRLGPHEMPRAMELRDALPRTPVGKLSKLELRREEAEKAAHEQARSANQEN